LSLKGRHCIEKKVKGESNWREEMLNGKGRVSPNTRNTQLVSILLYV